MGNATGAKIMVSGARWAAWLDEVMHAKVWSCHTSSAEEAGIEKFLLSFLFKKEVKSMSRSCASAVITGQVRNSCETTCFTTWQPGVLLRPFRYICETRLAARTPSHAASLYVQQGTRATGVCLRKSGCQRLRAGLGQASPCLLFPKESRTS